MMGSKPVNLSGSRGAAILGLSDYTTRFEVWQKIQEERNPGFNEKLGYELPVFEGNAFTRFGHAFEDSIIELAEEKQNKAIINREKLYTAKRMGYSFITCHIDGMYTDCDIITPLPSESKLHEGKTTTEWSFRLKWGDPGTDRVPQEYQIQAQHQMLCTGAEEVIFSVLVFPKAPTDWEDMGWIPENRSDIDKGWILQKQSGGWNYCAEWARVLNEMGFFHQFIVPRNQDLIDKMVEEYSQFWHENILGEKPPEPKNLDDIIRMIPNPCGTIIVDDRLADWYKEYKDINSELGSGGQMAKRKDQLKVLILDHARKCKSDFDEESADKWLFVTESGEKVGTWSKNKKGAWCFR